MQSKSTVGTWGNGPKWNWRDLVKKKKSEAFGTKKIGILRHTRDTSITVLLLLLYYYYYYYYYYLLLLLLLLLFVETMDVHIYVYTDCINNVLNYVLGKRIGRWNVQNYHVGAIWWNYVE